MQNATRDIEADSEIFAPYGAAYWNAQAQVQQQQLPPAPTYTVRVVRPLLILYGGMSFTDPLSAVPATTDDVRYRMLGHLVQNAAIKSLGTQASTSTHMDADVRTIMLRRSSAAAEIQRCGLFTLDSTFHSRRTEANAE